MLEGVRIEGLVVGIWSGREPGLQGGDGQAGVSGVSDVGEVLPL